MKKYEFESQIDRLRKNYGDRSIPNERVLLFWKEYGLAERPDFEACISEIILNCRYAPMITDFRSNFTGKVSSGRLAKIEHIKENNPCNLCDNTGSVATKSGERRCSCELGEAGLCYPAYIKRVGE